jgi:hypothetical protein
VIEGLLADPHLAVRVRDRHAEPDLLWHCHELFQHKATPAHDFSTALISAPNRCKTNEQQASNASMWIANITLKVFCHED